jgi:hypothetical protein
MGAALIRAPSHLEHDHSQHPEEHYGTARVRLMDEETQREIASKVGKAAHQNGTGQELVPKEAGEAVKKSGETATSGDSSAAVPASSTARPASRATKGANQIS